MGEHLLAEAFRATSGHSGRSNLTLDALRDRVKGNKVLEARLEQLLAPVPKPPETLEMERKAERMRAEMERRDAEDIDYVRAREPGLRRNQAEPKLLYHLAEAYFGRHIGGGDATGRKALERLLKGDQRLAQAAHQGLRKTIHRSDIPDVVEILELRKTNRMHFLGLPYLASMAEHYSEIPENMSRQELDRFRTALMFYFCGFMGDYKPDWYAELLTVRPEVVAEVQLQFTLVEMRRGQDHIDRLFQLAHNPDCAEVAGKISLPLLRAFPTRCRASQIDSLNHLLWAAIQNADREVLQKLIDGKLSRKSMNVAQRAQWLMAGLVISSEEYGSRVKEFAGKADNRSRLLADFFNEGVYFREDLLSYLDTLAMGIVVGICGRSFGPDLLRAMGAGESGDVGFSPDTKADSQDSVIAFGPSQGSLGRAPSRCESLGLEICPQYSPRRPASNSEGRDVHTSLNGERGQHIERWITFQSGRPRFYAGRCAGRPGSTDTNRQYRRLASILE